ncbi:hypothetical protein CQR47_1527 [Bifidobacterium thermophilum]|uniref:Uncharacterized protein n=1 Tax=Bifidobacterium thermophilum TaxID=33905 RepID=A0A2N3QG13_9BIFI|nr:hypothetical protein CQR48_1592 [Bifidobacterium thermophilum]PKU89639.1 hypothetical protein CQR47_1527 [Bifidobacterium thermophilum]
MRNNTINSHAAPGLSSITAADSINSRPVQSTQSSTFAALTGSYVSGSTTMSSV